MQGRSILPQRPRARPLGPCVLPKTSGNAPSSAWSAALPFCTLRTTRVPASSPMPASAQLEQVTLGATVIACHTGERNAPEERRLRRAGNFPIRKLSLVADPNASPKAFGPKLCHPKTFAPAGAQSESLPSQKPPPQPEASHASDGKGVERSLQGRSER